MNSNSQREVKRYEDNHDRRVITIRSGYNHSAGRPSCRCIYQRLCTGSGQHSACRSRRTYGRTSERKAGVCIMPYRWMECRCCLWTGSSRIWCGEYWRRISFLFEKETKWVRTGWKYYRREAERDWTQYHQEIPQGNLEKVHERNQRIRSDPGRR